MRLDKLLSNLKYGSRKEIKELVKKKAIIVNGVLCKDSGMDVHPEKDEIFVFDEPVFYKENITLMMNKPQNYISSNVDELYPSVLNLLPEKYKRFDFNIAGRLDYDTTGLLILTTDGELIHRITSPNKEIDKTYYVKTKAPIIDENRLLKTMTLLDGNNNPYSTKATMIKLLSQDELEITIHEGKFHQVKRMIEKIDNEVIYLKRIKIGNLALPCDLLESECIEIDADVIFK